MSTCSLLISAVAKGLAVQPRDGASREKLAEIGRLAILRAFLVPP